MKKFLSVIGCAVIFTFLFTGCGQKVELAATVNGDKITKPELETRMKQIAARYGYDLDTDQGKEIADYLQEQVLQSMIEEKVILQAAAEKKITVKDEDVDAEFNKFKGQFSSDEEYKNFLTEGKYTEKDIKTYIKSGMIYDKLFADATKDITTTGKDPQKYYDENKEEFYQNEQIKARNIVVKTADEAKTVIARLNKGEDFAKLAVELSIDPTAQQNQGDIGYFDKDAGLVEEFKTAAFKLKVGEYTKTPVQSEFGFHIIKVEDKKPARQRPFADVKAELLERFLMEDKNEKFSTYVDELMAKAKIEKKLPEKTPAAGAAQTPQGAQPGNQTQQNTQPQQGSQPQQSGSGK